MATQKLQPREMEWQLRCSHWRAISIGTGRGVNDKSLGTCGGPKQPNHNNISVTDGTEASKLILGTDKRVLVGCKIPGVSLGHDKIQGVKVLVSCKIPGVTWGYDKFRQVITKIAAVKLMVLDSQIDFDDVGKPTRVDMHAPEVARHEMGFPTDKIGSFWIKGKVADFGQHRVDPN